MFHLSEEKLDLEALRTAIAGPAFGACVTFEGLVRNQNLGREVECLQYEAYPAMALKEGGKIVVETLGLFPIQQVHCVHRVGMLAIGDVAIWIGVASAHRREAFQACSHVIDQIKLRVPIWKREFYSDGEPHWVGCAIPR